ncbi:hypothetical protein EON65_07590 [archaeon]|nr:MAG: hypothetical protein EON65_07590 [archaeon]
MESKIPTIDTSPEANPDIVGHLLLGKLHLVDLAGGERVDRSKPVGDNLLEAQFINKSLLALGEVLHTLASNASIQKKNSRLSLDPMLPMSPTNKQLSGLHVPYLDNRLTHFLKDSFGGYVRTVMIANIGPEADNYNVNLHCLQYTSKALRVCNPVSYIRIDIPSHIETDPFSEISIINQLKQKILDPPKSTRKVRRSIVPSTPTVKKVISYSFTIHSIAVEDISYICLPFHPWVQVEIGSVIHKTAKVQYTVNFARYPESMTFEIAGEDLEAGIELDMRVCAKAPFRKRREVGRAKAEIKKVFPVLEERSDLELPVYQLDHSTGDVYAVGRVLLTATLRPSLTSKASVFDFKILQPKKSMLTIAKPLSAIKEIAPVDLKKRIILSIKKITTPDVLVLSDAPTGEMFQPYSFSLEAKFGTDSLRTPFLAGKLRTRNKDVTGNLCFDDPDMDFDMSREAVQFEELHVLVFAKVGEANTSRAIGRAVFSLGPLALKPDDESIVELSSTIKDVSGGNAGKMFINASLAPSGRDRRSSEEALNLTHQHTNIPKDLKYGWVKINTVEAVGLNSLKLLGRHVRYQHLDGTTTFDALTKQDLLLVLEYGNKWVSHSPVMTDHEDSCTWEDLDFRFLVSREDFLHDSVRISVFNRKFSGKEGIIGSAILALQQFVSDPSLSIAHVPVKLRSVKNKVNGILHIDGIVIKDAGGEWIPGSIETVHNNGRYDIRYDDGEMEANIGKDFLKLAPPGGHPEGGIAWRPPSPRHDSTKYPEGTKVEVRFGTKDVWLPATIDKARDDGTYDITSSYDLPLQNVDETCLRLPGGLDRSSPNLKLSPSKGNLRFLYSVGDKVEGNFKAKGKWYKAFVYKTYMNNDLPTYDLDYASGVRESGLTDERIRLFDEARTLSASFMSPPNKSIFNVEDEDEEDVKPVTDVDDLDFTEVTPRGRSRQRSSPSHNRARSHSPNDDKLSLSHSRRSMSSSRLPRMASEKSLSMSKLASHRSMHELLLEKAGLLEGDRVEVAAKLGQEHKLGAVREILPNNLFNVELDSGGVLEHIPRDQIRLLAEELENVNRVYPFMVGDKIQCNYRETGDWLVGVITKDRGYGIYDIEYLDGHIETKVTSDFIRRAAATQFELKFAVGDKVEVRSDDLGYWYPAIIHKTRAMSRSYDIRYADGQRDIYVSERLIRPGRNDTGEIPPIRPTFIAGDRVYVKSKSKAFGMEIKAFAEGIRKSDEVVKILFGLMRTVEEEEAYMQVKKETSNKNIEEIQKLNNQINEFDSMNPSLLHHSDLAEMHEDFQKAREDVEENDKILEKEDPRIAELLKDLRADVAKASALVRQRLSMNYVFLTQRSGLGDEELHALTVALESLRAEIEAIEKAVKNAKKVISSLLACRHSLTEQEKRTVMGKKVGRELVDAMQSAIPKEPVVSHLTAANLSPLNRSSSNQSVLNRFDSKRSLIEEMASIDFGDIYESANGNEFELQTSKRRNKDDAFFDDLDHVEEYSDEDLDVDSVQEPDIDMRRNTGMGGLLLSFRDLKAESTDDSSISFGDKKRPSSGKMARFADLPSSNSVSKQVRNMRHEVLSEVDSDDGKVDTSKKSKDLDGYVTILLSRSGNKVIALEFEPKASAFIDEPTSPLDGTFTLIPVSVKKDDNRVYDARKNLDEKKAKALVARFAYIKAVEGLKSLDGKVKSAVSDCHEFINKKELSVALDKALGEETRLIDKQLQNVSEALSKAVEARMQTFKSASDHDAQALELFKKQAACKGSSDEILKKVDECKTAYVVGWSTWEEAKLAVEKEVGLYNEMYQLNRKKLDALKHLHQLHHKFELYKHQRKMLLRKEQEVLDTYKETLDYHKDLLTYKEQVESEAAAWEYYNKKVKEKEMNKRRFSRRSLLSLNASAGNLGSPNTKDQSIFMFDNIDTMTPVQNSSKLLRDNRPSSLSKQFNIEEPISPTQTPLKQTPRRSASMLSLKPSPLAVQLPLNGHETGTNSNTTTPMSSLSINTTFAGSPLPINIATSEENKSETPFTPPLERKVSLGASLGLSLSINTAVEPVPQSNRAMTERPSNTPLSRRHSLTIMINPDTGHIVPPPPPPPAPTLSRPNTPRVQADRKALQDIKSKLALNDNYYEHAKLRTAEENKIEELLNEYNKQLVYLNEDDYKIIKTEKRLYSSSYYTTLHLPAKQTAEMNVNISSLSLIPPTSSMYSIMVNLNNIINENHTQTDENKKGEFSFDNTIQEDKKFNNDNIQLIANNQDTLLFEMITDITYLSTSVDYIEKAVELRSRLLATLKKIYNSIQFSIECCKLEYKAYHTSIQSIHNDLDANSNTVKNIINAHRLHTKYIAKIKKLLFILLLNNQEISSLEVNNREKEGFITKEQFTCNSIVDTIQSLKKSSVSISDNPVIQQINNLLVQVDEVKTLIANYKKNAMQCDNNIAGLDMTIRDIALQRLEQDFVTNWEEENNTSTNNESNSPLIPASNSTTTLQNTEENSAQYIKVNSLLENEISLYNKGILYTKQRVEYLYMINHHMTTLLYLLEQIHVLKEFLLYSLSASKYKELNTKLHSIVMSMQEQKTSITSEYIHHEQQLKSFRTKLDTLQHYVSTRLRHLTHTTEYSHLVGSLAHDMQEIESLLNTVSGFMQTTHTSTNDLETDHQALATNQEMFSKPIHKAAKAYEDWRGSIIPYDSITTDAPMSHSHTNLIHLLTNNPEHNHEYIQTLTLLASGVSAANSAYSELQSLYPVFETKSGMYVQYTQIVNENIPSCYTRLVTTYYELEAYIDKEKVKRKFYTNLGRLALGNEGNRITNFMPNVYILPDLTTSLLSKYSSEQLTGLLKDARVMMSDRFVGRVRGVSQDYVPIPTSGSRNSKSVFSIELRQDGDMEAILQRATKIDLLNLINNSVNIMKYRGHMKIIPKQTPSKNLTRSTTNNSSANKLVPALVANIERKTSTKSMSKCLKCVGCVLCVCVCIYVHVCGHCLLLLLAWTFIFPQFNRRYAGRVLHLEIPQHPRAHCNHPRPAPLA